MHALACFLFPPGGIGMHINIFMYEYKRGSVTMLPLFVIDLLFPRGIITAGTGALLAAACHHGNDSPQHRLPSPVTWCLQLFHEL